MTDRTSRRAKLVACAALLVSPLLARTAAADVTLADQDGWEVFLGGRIQTFANYNDGQGRPANGSTGTFVDNAGNPIEIRGGGIDSPTEALRSFKMGTQATADDPGKIQELRLRSGFTGNVLAFGIRKKLSENTSILGFTAVTVGIDTEQRRKFLPVQPDWRESFIRLTSTWGTLTAGRTLTLFSRGALEITYLYGYRYGLGFPGSVSSFSQSTAGSVGFGVLANGFGPGIAYATPVLGGIQLSVGVYDANAIPTTGVLNRGKWPRLEYEATFERQIGATGLVKLFSNGAFQSLYDYDGRAIKTDVWGTGFGGRLEIGPVKLGVAGHYGRGIGVTYTMEPHGSLYFVEATQRATDCNLGTGPNCPAPKMRTVDGGYVQTQIAVTKQLDVRAGAGVTRVAQLPEDANVGLMDSLMVHWVTLRQQIGIGAGLTLHVDKNVHLTLEYFRAQFQWWKPANPVPNSSFPSQVVNFVNAGITYDF